MLFHPETILVTLLCIRVFLPKYFFFSAVLCRLKALGICTEALWIKVDFFYEVGLEEKKKTNTLNFTLDNPIFMHIQ